MSDGRSKPRPGAAEQKRNLVDVAVRLFAEHGSRTVSVSQICVAADVSRDTFYRCFNDKDDLIGEIWELAANRPIESVVFEGLPHRGFDDLGPGGDLEQWVDGTIDRLLDAVFAEHELAHFAFAEYGDPTSSAHQAINIMFDGYADKLEQWVGKWHGVGANRLVLKALMAGVQWILLETIRGGIDERTRRAAKVGVSQLVLAVFRAVLGAGRVSGLHRP